MATGNSTESEVKVKHIAIFGHSYVDRLPEVPINESNFSFDIRKFAWGRGNYS